MYIFLQLLSLFLPFFPLHIDTRERRSVWYPCSANIRKIGTMLKIYRQLREKLVNIGRNRSILTFHSTVFFNWISYEHWVHNFENNRGNFTSIDVSRSRDYVPLLGNVGSAISWILSEHPSFKSVNSESLKPIVIALFLVQISFAQYYLRYRRCFFKATKHNTWTFPLAIHIERRKKF